jgi:hypothetical protein
MTQLAYETGVPVSWAFWATAFLALGHLLLGISPGMLRPPELADPACLLGGCDS